MTRKQTEELYHKIIDMCEEYDIPAFGFVFLRPCEPGENAPFQSRSCGCNAIGIEDMEDLKGDLLVAFDSWLQKQPGVESSKEHVRRN